MQTSTQLTIAVFGENDTVTADILASWFHASVTLEGPFSAQTLSVDEEWNFAAAIIDVRYAPEIMLPLMEILEARSIPFVFFVPFYLVGTEAGPFVLSPKSTDIDGILSALAAQEPVTRH